MFRRFLSPLGRKRKALHRLVVNIPPIFCFRSEFIIFPCSRYLKLRDGWIKGMVTGQEILFYTVTSFTKFSFKSWATQAVKTAHIVHTRGSISTWTLLTFVNICSKKNRTRIFRIIPGSDKMLRSFNVCFAFIDFANRILLPLPLSMHSLAAFRICISPQVDSSKRTQTLFTSLKCPSSSPW